MQCLVHHNLGGIGCKLLHAFPAGWYCVGCEAYKDDSEMEGDRMCPMHKKRCIERQEENYFFALSKYQSQIQVRPGLRRSAPICKPLQLQHSLHVTWIAL